MILKVPLLVLTAILGIESVPFKIGCLKCHEIDENKINVHLIPHSHDDVGWLKTVDQYYYGMNTSIQQAGVQYIITSVVEALAANSDRRYIQVETAYFWKWWKSQTETMRSQFKSLVNNGQIEMVNGAWSMNDEACSNYQSTIDQFTLGLRIISDTVESCGTPRVGWQIDPFGHSREQASLFAQLGYDGVFFARLDHDEKEQRQESGSLDFAWQGSANLDNSVIFGGIFPTILYNPPNGFCWDYDCTDEPIDDDPESPNYNIKEKIKIFTDLVKNYTKYYPTKNLIIPMGGDFQYEAAEMNYINMDRFIRGFENDTDLNVIYSTPSCYIQAVYNAKPTLALKTYDFFPYSNDAHSFWTGYFTSRPNSKRFERIGHNILQATRQLYALNSVNSSKSYSNYLKYLREVMGVMQHHDAITGTEKQHVANDYVRLLSRGIERAEAPVGEIVSQLLKSSVALDFASCLLSNISICSVSQHSEQFVVLVYNPLAWNVTYYVRLPVEEGGAFEINGPDGIEIYDVVPVIDSFDFVNISGVKSSQYELVFKAKDLPALGFKMYHINKTGRASNDGYKPTAGNGVLTLGDEVSGFQINTTTNLLKSVTLNNITLNISQNFYYYKSKTGELDNTNISSGAYLFRPENSFATNVSRTANNLTAFSGLLVDEFHQKWNNHVMNISQIIRVYKQEGHIEFDWIVGGIDIEKDPYGKEVISRFTITDEFDSKTVFYTDSNGREMIKRTKNSRPDYTYNYTAEEVASNYYPVTSRIVIKDAERNIEVAVLTDRSQGGSSLEKDQIELMVHRRIIHDDNKGVGENLNETEFGQGVYVRGTHYLVIGKANTTNSNGKTTAAQERILAQKKLIQPWVGLAVTNSSYEDIQKNMQLLYSPLSTELPENVNILTFEEWTNNSYLLRLEHILEKNDDPNLSSSTTVDIQALFKNYAITELTETTLGANQLLDQYQKRQKYWWNVTSPKMEVVSTVPDSSKLSISLTPMQIRTFVIKLGQPEKPDVNFGINTKPFVFIVLALSFLGLVVA